MQFALTVPSTDDKLVQEIVRMILESIYEPTFSKVSHGFRPRRSCHTALTDIKERFTGMVWCIEGDIQACFESFDHRILVSILRRRIHDEAFIELIWKLLRAGVMEQWRFGETYSGTPQGSGASPILANIYLSEFDNYMQGLKENFDAGQRERHHNPDYKRLKDRHARSRRKYKAAARSGDKAQAKELLKIAKQDQALKLIAKPFPNMDTSYRRIQYCRYCDDFVIGVIGSKADAEGIKADVGTFLQEKLKLTLSQEKTAITHASRKIRFLGYDMSVYYDQSIRYTRTGAAKRVFNGHIQLYLPREKWQGKLREYKAFRITRDKNNLEHWKPTRRGPLVNLPAHEIVERYNSEIRGIYNFYRLACNVSVLSKFYWMMLRSLQKTLATKYKTYPNKIRRKFQRDGVLSVPYSNKNGKTLYREFYHDGFRKNSKVPPTWSDTLPTYRKYLGGNSLAVRLRKGICELCGEEAKGQITMHHVKRLKDLTGNTPWEDTMRAIRRKSLAVCPDCWKVIHGDSDA